MKLIIAGGKIDREAVRNKFGGLCAYTGKPLRNWQIDHVIPICSPLWKRRDRMGKENEIDNLLPAIKIVNHYKRGDDLETFRAKMLTFHLRLAKLPKNTTLARTLSRIAYMRRIAELFDITIDKPFSGKFYFETI